MREKNWITTRRKRTRRLNRPSLRFSPTAFAKLRHLRDYGETEIGGFGLSAADDLLYIEDFLPVKQRCTPVTVAFDDGAVADLVDRLVDEGIAPERFSRVWIHTHPGDCPLPSFVDEATFRRVFGRNDWSVMAILARSEASYARLSFRAGPGAAMEIPVHVDYNRPFAGTDRPAWQQEYREAVVPVASPFLRSTELPFEPSSWLDDFLTVEGDLHGVADAEPV